MKIHFIFCTSLEWWKAIGVFLIKFIDRVDSNHFAIVIEGYSEPKVYETTFPKYKISKYSDWIKSHRIDRQFTYDVPTHLQYKVVEWLESHNGKRYSVFQLLFIAAAIFKPINKILNWGILNHDRALICTEVGSRFMEKFMGLIVKESHDKIGMFDLIKIVRKINLESDIYGSDYIWRVKE